jgi:hypothetical protein
MGGGGRLSRIGGQGRAALDSGAPARTGQEIVDDGRIRGPVSPAP